MTAKLAILIPLPVEPPLTAEEDRFPRGYARALRSGTDPLEALDAIQECAHGRMPGYQGPACACWTPRVVEVAHAA